MTSQPLTSDDAIADLRDKLNRKRAISQLNPGDKVRTSKGEELVFASATMRGGYAAVRFVGVEHPVPMPSDTLFFLAD